MSLTNVASGRANRLCPVCGTVCRASALLAMAVNGAIFIPNVEACRDAGNVNAVRMCDRLIVRVKFEHCHSEDIVTVVDEMRAVLPCHGVLSCCVGNARPLFNVST